MSIHEHEIAAQPADSTDEQRQLCFLDFAQALDTTDPVNALRTSTEFSQTCGVGILSLLELAEDPSAVTGFTPSDTANSDCAGQDSPPPVAEPEAQDPRLRERLTSLMNDVRRLAPVMEPGPRQVDN
jgi:hypothetical protein